MPNFEGFENGKQFLVVVEFRWGKGLRVESDWMDFVVSWRYSGKDGSECIVKASISMISGEPRIQ